MPEPCSESLGELLLQDPDLGGELFLQGRWSGTSNVSQVGAERGGWGLGNGPGAGNPAFSFPLASQAAVSSPAGRPSSVTACTTTAYLT